MAGDSETPWAACPSIDLDLDREPSARFAELLPAQADRARELLEGVLAEVPPAALAVVDQVDEVTQGRFAAEMGAVAEWLGADPRHVALANVSYDLALAAFGCSTAAVVTAQGPVLFRNMDWWPEQVLARSSCRLRYVRHGALEFATGGWLAASGVVTGLSARGFAVALNAVSGPEGVDLGGYPVLLHLRCVLEDARDFGHAVQLLSETRLAAPALFMVVGTEPKERLVIERSPSRFAHRSADGDAPLVVTNDYRALFGSVAPSGDALAQTACDRFDTLAALAEGLDPTADPEDAQLLRALSDDRVRMDITAQQVVARPAAGELGLWVPRRLL